MDGTYDTPFSHKILEHEYTCQTPQSPVFTIEPKTGRSRAILYLE